MTLVALGLAAPTGAVLLQRRRARAQPRSRVERIAVAIQQRPLLAPSLLAGAGALAGAYLSLRRRRAVRRVRDAMTANPRAAESSMLLSEAAQLMNREDVGSLPVVENERLVGMLTDRDIVTRAVAEGVDASACRVSDIASRELVTVEPEQDLGEALKLMARHNRPGPSPTRVTARSATFALDGLLSHVAYWGGVRRTACDPAQIHGSS